MWTADAGGGLVQSERLTAIPIVYEKRGPVHFAHSVANGRVEWRFKARRQTKSGFDYLHPFNSNNVVLLV